MTNAEYEAMTPAERKAWIDRLTASWANADARKMDAEDAKDRRDEADNDWTR